MRLTHHDETLSPEARDFLSKSRPMGFGWFPLVPRVAALVRRRRAATLRPVLRQIREERIASIVSQSIAGVPVAIITPKRLRDASAGAMATYIHGGAYVFGEPVDPTALLMADALGLPVWSIGYRLAPEHAYPAALDDAIAVHRLLVERFDARRTLAFGVSAGGSLLASMLLRARDEGLPLPAAAALFTPWSDITHHGDSFASNDGRDPVITWKNQLDRAARAYVGDADPRSPSISPIHGSYGEGFPPTLITTGTRDLLLSHSVRLYWALRRAGIPAELRVWEGMWHSFQSAPAIPESVECRAEVARYLVHALEPAAARGLVGEP
jgi:epsilon-lactone hydrolase